MIIYTTDNRKAKYFKRIEISWEEFAKSLKEPSVTEETQKEYFSMPKEKQDELKDVGGFVGGELDGGVRKASTILNRCLLTLDADYGNPQMLNYLASEADYTYVVYSTRKHTSDNPRYRVIIPLSEPVTPEKYEALARKVAELIGIDYFDDTTYQPNRLMYYPSKSKDGEYYYLYKENNNVTLDVNKILSLYDNWQDVSQWKSSSRQKSKLRVQRQRSRQQDPREKEGIIGALCNAYDIHEAIEEHLYDIYTPGEDGRYTYVLGSTQNGVIVYDDGLFTYSNHSTDPTCGRLCNVFDLIRIHKFGELDRLTPDTEDKPSVKAMIKWTLLDKKVRNKIAQKDFEEINVTLKTNFDTHFYKTCYASNFYQNRIKCSVPHSVTFIRKLIEKKQNVTLENNWKTKLNYGEGANWERSLVRDKKGKIKINSENVMLILRNDKDLASISYNELEYSPWIKEQAYWVQGKADRRFKEVDEDWILDHFERKYKMVKKEYILSKLNMRISENRFNPVRDYLNTLSWDGTPRIEKLLIEYLGVEDSIYTREATRKVLIAAVKRIYEPGCKFDECLVLVGKQGIGKSQIIKKLGGKWAKDSLTTYDGKQPMEALRGAWIMEIAELAAMKKAEGERVKHFKTQEEDVYRPAYGKYIEDFPRQCIFIGTTNTHDFLKDPTGNRRYYPMTTDKSKITKDLWTELTKAEVDQIWGEAIHYYKQGERLQLSSEAEKIAEEKRKIHTEQIPYQESLKEYLDMPVPEDWGAYSLLKRRDYINSVTKEGTPRNKICVLEIWQELLNGEKKELSVFKSREIRTAVLRTEEWEYQSNVTRFGVLYGHQRYFRRK